MSGSCAHLTYTPATEGDLDAASRVLDLAFAGGFEGTREWLGKSGVEHLRVLRDTAGGGAATGATAAGPGGIDLGLAATLMRVPMGHFVGGRSVPCVGIAGVSVPPERRGGGVASHLMRSALREIHEEGVALSSLYASTRALYRRVGYELAWHWNTYQVPLWRIGLDPAEPALRRVDPGDEGVQRIVKGLYERFAPTQAAMLDRREYVWMRVFKPRGGGDPKALFIGDDAADPEAYVVFIQERNPETGHHDVLVSDVASRTPRGWGKALGAMRRFCTTGDHVRFAAGPNHPWLLLDTEHTAKIVRHEPGMLRIVRLEDAIRGRGYPVGVDAEVVLDIEDDLFAGNAGRWRLRVRDGRGEASRVSSGGDAIRVPIRALASLYTGFISPRQAAIVGWIEGPGAALDALGAALAGPTPWMPNFF
ncbi:MAG: GNAT family N-acetyltransferase [Phycisphaerales bacterium]